MLSRIFLFRNTFNRTQPKSLNEILRFEYLSRSYGAAINYWGAVFFFLVKWCYLLRMLTKSLSVTFKLKFL